MVPCSPIPAQACRRSLHSCVRLLIALVLCSAPGLASAQTATATVSHWGVGVSYSPRWVSDNTFKDVFISEGEENVEGTEFSIGFVRGSTRGGDIGVSYVRKPFKDGSLTEAESDCSSPGSCYSFTQTREMQGVFVQGVEVHGFLAFATIKNRVQIGVNIAGGIGAVRGTVRQTTVFESSTTLPNGQPIIETDTSVETGPAADYMLKYFPLGKAEVEAALIVAPGLKIKFAGGLNVPSTVSFRIAAVYLIGAK